MSTGMTALLLALVAMLGNAEYLLGTTMLSRPLVMGMLTGLVMGDLKTGIIMGGTLELAFLGTFSIGASIPPEAISGTVLGTAFAISAGESPSVALTLALPIASLVLIVKNLGFIFVFPTFVHKADQYAEEANHRGIDMMNLLSGFFAINLPIGLVVGISYYLGGGKIEGLLNMIPEFVTSGLEIATGLLPAYGFALLLNMMINKRNVVFFLLGFALIAYFGIDVTGVAILSTILAFILTGYSAFNGAEMSPADAAPVVSEETEGGIDYDSEEF
ncbi:PTS mannose/fructose/sorbose/N-acetylgalactosamine transporter subunit IIC [Allofustis seminis]|uniref:PTS mannose/fructose/sorbose/N-acetylgalactosamine transporter subunit IIC n=1 Tax=Allofustis seminis TaxID=166939 RepID=UPI00037210BE|nr:PTS sugar transporter subunit IIC [Allofustis seminis]